VQTDVALTGAQIHGRPSRAEGIGAATALMAFVLAGVGPPLAHADPPIRPDTPPATLVQAVCRPVLSVDGEPLASGTAFILHGAAERPGLWLVTAQHLFGMDGHAKGPIPWNQMPGRARSATCHSLDGTRTWAAGPALAIEGAHAMGALTGLRDIAIMPVSGQDVIAAAGPKIALALAPNAPRAGEKVWLVAQTVDRGHAGQRLFAAEVLSLEGCLAFAYEAADLDLSNTSGAPVVDIEGRVVGVNVAVSHYAGAIIGFADDLDTVRSALRTGRR
jgi:hypothetical protein